MKKILIVLTVMLSACSSTKTHVIPVATDVPVFQPGNPRAITMKDFEWQVLETKRLEALLAQAKKDNKPIVLFALTAKGYENLSLDMKELQRYIEQLQQVIIYYKKATKPAATTQPSK